jgi:hypothetical protein
MQDLLATPLSTSFMRQTSRLMALSAAKTGQRGMSKSAMSSTKVLSISTPNSCDIKTGALRFLLVSATLSSLQVSKEIQHV